MGQRKKTFQKPKENKIQLFSAKYAVLIKFPDVAYCLARGKSMSTFEMMK
jgi:hypothetical protein